MLDFTEQEAWTTSQPESSPDTQTVSGNHPGTNVPSVSNDTRVTKDFFGNDIIMKPLFDAEAQAKTDNALAPYRDNAEYYQDDEETKEV